MSRRVGASVATLCATVVALAGCATIIDGVTQAIKIESDPPGATCELRRAGATLGTVRTPGQMTVDKAWQDIDVTCTKDGFASGEATVKSITPESNIFTMVMGGLISSIVDSATGAHLRYPERTIVSLAPLGSRESGAANAIFLGTFPSQTAAKLAWNDMWAEIGDLVRQDRSYFKYVKGEGKRTVIELYGRSLTAKAAERACERLLATGRACIAKRL